MGPHLRQGGQGIFGGQGNVSGEFTVDRLWGNLNGEFYGGPETVYTSLSYPALLFDWVITQTLTLTVSDNIILDGSAGSKSGVYVDFHTETRDHVHFTFAPGTFV